MASLLAARIEDRPPDDLVFTTQHGQPLRNLNWRRDVRWNQVCRSSSLPVSRPMTFAEPSAA